MLSSYAREFPLPLRQTAATAAARWVFSANNAHACHREWVQLDVSSRDEIETDTIIG